MTRYGSDKPDLRYDYALHDISTGFVASAESESELELPKNDAADVSLEILPYQHHAAGSLSKKELEDCWHLSKAESSASVSRRRTTSTS